MFHIKAGVSQNYFKDTYEFEEQKYDLHLRGGISIVDGFAISFNYDYGPMVSSGLYQYSNDSENNSINIMPQLMGTFFNERVSLNLFTNLSYRIDLEYGSINAGVKNHESH